MTQRLNPKIISVPVGQGVFSVPRGTMKLTVYLCGAGASSGYNSYHKPNIFETFHTTGGAGGSGAYMKLYMYRRNYNIPQTISYNNAAAQSTTFLQDGGAVSVTIMVQHTLLVVALNHISLVARLVIRQTTEVLVVLV